MDVIHISDSLHCRSPCSVAGDSHWKCCGALHCEKRQGDGKKIFRNG